MNNHEISQLVSELPTVAIVANGEFVTNPILINKLKSSAYIACCDGAINNLIKHNITPNVVIGDCDSISNSIISQYNVIKIEEQNSNDLSKAIYYLKSHNVQQIVIYSASGLREDHSIANLAIFYQAAKEFSHIYMLSNYGVFSVCHTGNNIIKTIPKQQISFFTLEQNISLSCQELKWPLNNMHFEYLNLGTLNQATKEYINLKSTGRVIVYRAFETKN